MNKIFRITMWATAAMLIAACGQQAEAPKEQAGQKAPAAPTTTVEKSAAAPAAVVRESLIKPIDAAVIKEPLKVELGKKLYFDPRLSKSGALSCNSCHNLMTSGTDNLTSSIGHGWVEGPINSPTVYNSVFNIKQFWDGRADTLKAQAGGPIENPKEMASTHEHVVTVLNSIPQYVGEFKKAYGVEKVAIDQVVDAIALFEETLVTPNARFDQWLRGDDKALTEQEKKGYELFTSTGCIACHNGAAVGATSFQKFGVYGKYLTKNGATGRGGVTKNPDEMMVFKVPTLRNIELTYPYFHDGAVNNLADAVNVMAKIQLDKTFTAEENAQIVAFLKTLTGERPKMEMPLLPPSTDKTPLPEPFKKK